MKMTAKQDDNYDKKHNIKENGKMDIKVDAKHGLPAHMAAKSPVLANSNNGPAMNGMKGTKTGGSNVVTDSAGVEKPHAKVKPGSGSGK